MLPEINRLSLAFGNHTILNDLSLTVAERESISFSSGSASVQLANDVFAIRFHASTYIYYGYSNQYTTTWIEVANEISW